MKNASVNHIRLSATGESISHPIPIPCRCPKHYHNVQSRHKDGAWQKVLCNEKECSAGGAVLNVMPDIQMVMIGTDLYNQKYRY